MRVGCFTFFYLVKTVVCLGLSKLASAAHKSIGKLIMKSAYDKNSKIRCSPESNYLFTVIGEQAN